VTQARDGDRLESRRDSGVATPNPILIISSRGETAGPIAEQLRALGHLPVWVIGCETAMEMIEVAQFAAAIVEIDRYSDWVTCRRLAAMGRAPIAVMTSLLAPDRRYRRRAFRMGVSAYLGPPITRRRLRELLKHLRAGVRFIELVGTVTQQSDVRLWRHIGRPRRPSRRSRE
jgi:DNA-binding response OmpR family regulator